MPVYFLGKSNRKNKKCYIRELNGNKSIHFGDSRYTDYTINKDDARKYRYLLRHSNEDWALSGINKPGFWSRWLLWNRRTIKQSIKDLERRFKIKVRVLKNS